MLTILSITILDLLSHLLSSTDLILRKSDKFLTIRITFSKKIFLKRLKYLKTHKFYRSLMNFQCLIIFVDSQDVLELSKIHMLIRMERYMENAEEFLRCMMICKVENCSWNLSRWILDFIQKRINKIVYKLLNK